MNNNIDVNQLMKMLSTMDKKDLETGMNKLSSILNSNDKSKILNQLKNNTNHK